MHLSRFFVRVPEGKVLSSNSRKAILLKVLGSMGPKAIKHVNMTILFSQHQPFLVFPQLLSIFSFYNNSVRGFTEQTSMKLIFRRSFTAAGKLAGQ